MYDNVVTGKLDCAGRITIPVEFRRNLHIKKLEKIEFTTDGDKIIIQKHRNNDIFGNLCNDNFLEYHGSKVSKKSIIELAKLAGIL